MRFLPVLLLAAALGAPSDRYESVTINADGSVTVNTVDGRHITPPQLAAYSPGMEHVGTAQAAVSPDHQSAGWLALFDWCCASYPIPLKLVIFRNGRLLSLKGSEAIWFWRFQEGGKRVAAREELPHGSQGLCYELWDVKSGKLVADYRPEYDENGHVVSRPKEPGWVKALDAAETGR